MNVEPLDVQVKALSFIFKSNLGTFLSKVQQQANTENLEKEKGHNSGDIESLLTDLDRVISNQKQLSELIQNGKFLFYLFKFKSCFKILLKTVKLHQKISKELESTSEHIKITQNSILSLIDNLRHRDLDLANKFLQARNFKRTLKAIKSSKLYISY